MITVFQLAKYIPMANPGLEKGNAFTAFASIPGPSILITYNLSTVSVKTATMREYKIRAEYIF